MSDDVSKNSAGETERLEVYICSVADAARNIRLYALKALNREPLPAFTAGAHIDLHLSNGLIRSYSICNRPVDGETYIIAVHRDPAGRGGSRFIHEHLVPGKTLHISRPRNHFPLDESAQHTIMIAGGIGITPFRPMIYHLQALKRSWQLYYCVRSRDCAAFIDEWQAMAEYAHIHVADEMGNKRLKIGSIVTHAPAETHFYCCGPQGMLAEFEQTLSASPHEYVHVEYFSAKETEGANDAFEVELARTGKSLHVAPDQSILEVVLDAGVEVSHACSEGVCGACETHVLSGIPDHRDSVLSFAEKSAGNKMLICCSRAKSERLVLDL